MKKISKIRLNRLSDSELEAKEQSRLYGGAVVCTCGCYFEGSGGDTKAINASNNWSRAANDQINSGVIDGQCSCVTVTMPGVGSGSTNGESRRNRW